MYISYYTQYARQQSDTLQSLGESHPSCKFVFLTFASLPWLEQRYTHARSLQSECEPFEPCRGHSKVYQNVSSENESFQNDSSDFGCETTASLAAGLRNLSRLYDTRDVSGEALDRDAVDQYDHHCSSVF